MDPIRAIGVCANVGASDAAPGVRALAGRAALLVAGAIALTVGIGTSVFGAWGMGHGA